MKVSMYAVSVEVFVATLQNLASVLEKGHAHATGKKFDPNILVNARLAPDMLPLSKQVQIACDIAKNSAARLVAQEPPRFEDTEKTFEELRARIDRTLDFIKGLPAQAFEASEERDIEVPVPNRTLRFKGLPFAQRWALPNLFFHAVTAYDILRHNGVELGKRDFLGDTGNG